MKSTCTKPQAATRQLDVAITLLFADYDPLAVRTLAAAAFGVLADLVERKLPGGSWRTKIIEGSGLSKIAAIGVINSAQNFLKHGDRDPDAQLELDEEENDHLMFIATLECGELGYPLSLDMQAFQIWYLAMYPDKIGVETQPVITSRQAFPDFDSLTREERLRRGAEFVALVKQRRGEAHAV